MNVRLEQSEMRRREQVVVQEACKLWQIIAPLMQGRDTSFAKAMREFEAVKAQREQEWKDKQ